MAGFTMRQRGYSNRNDLQFMFFSSVSFDKKVSDFCIPSEFLHSSSDILLRIVIHVLHVLMRRVSCLKCDVFLHVQILVMQ